MHIATGADRALVEDERSVTVLRRSADAPPRLREQVGYMDPPVKTLADSRVLDGKTTACGNQASTAGWTRQEER
jgi:hypothetical protein